MTDVAAGQLRQHRPFDRLSPERAAAVEPQLELRHYRLGQTLLRPELLAAVVSTASCRHATV